MTHLLTGWTAQPKAPGRDVEGSRLDQAILPSPDGVSAHDFYFFAEIYENGTRARKEPRREGVSMSDHAGYWIEIA